MLFEIGKSNKNLFSIVKSVKRGSDYVRKV